jgi:predicted acylesterase/phospholipase RssA
LVPLLETADLSADITLGAFFEATNIDLHLFTTRLNGITITDLSHTTFPDLSLINAVHMSCTIPFLFQPLYINGSYHVDGGVGCHFPLSQCLDQEVSEEEILAVSIQVTGESRTILREDTHILEYGLFLFQSLVDSKNALNNVTIPNMIIVPSGGLDLETGYKVLSCPEERQKLISSGREYARLFLLYKKRHDDN